MFAALADSLIRRDYKKLSETHVDYYVVCSNNFFDTTSGHILNINNKSVVAPNGKEFKVTFRLVNHPNPKVKAGTYSQTDKYLGDGDFESLSKLVNGHPEKIAVCFTTITNNSGGSQPVSVEHISAVSELCKKYNILYMMDACRFAENAFMIQQIEKSPKTVKQIVHELFEKVDGFTISLKKDGIVNCGGAVSFCPKSPAVQQFVDQEGGCMMQEIMDTIILQVGHFTYGALTGRDIKATCVGIRHAIREEYL